ncbi:hypothetical protein C2R22_05665 [Salinigranum rubrum]|uniref:Rhomboid family intramembrane serine protease n=1 Tax=Salinigranum rubrum TaxID=755307 RepID=A0A2I8VH19_9EURY|nr:hypothetical protein [Salinigranum rubrum]AUV81210.1 hypothetical protein C2R22_05665 [Salinigranum rubrum]
MRNLRSLSIVFVIAGVLALVRFTLPTNTQVALAFNHQNPSLYALWTSALVHESNAHLFNNLRGYLLTALPAYAAFALLDQRRKFWVTTVAFLVIVPPLATGLSFLVFDYKGIELIYSRGFSAVVGAYAGLAIIAGLQLVEEAPNTEIGYYICANYGLVLFAVFALEFPDLRLLFGILFFVSVLVLIWGFRREIVADPTEVGTWFKENTVVGAVSVVGFLSGVLIVLGLFPSEVAQGGTLVNFVGHGVGIIFGLLAGLNVL